MASFGLCGNVDPTTTLRTQEECFGLQPIEEGNSALVNVDDYAVEICADLDLNNDGNPDTPQEIYQAIKQNFLNLSTGQGQVEMTHCDLPDFGLIFPFTASWKFEPYEIGLDDVLWSNNTIGARFFINANTDNNLADLLNDNGAVITTQESDLNWVFSTIFTPRSKSQPFSGNRQFGLRTNENGKLEFYTRAIDRAHTTVVFNILEMVPLLTDESCDERDYFDIANLTWTNFQNNIAMFLGLDNVRIVEPKVKHLEYTVIYEKLKSNTPVNFVSCE